ncbi:methyltransferase domain-containing protein [Streptomyces heilongjiangensis]|uniref:SAM-dependent methyltransferase n=1 Tax=Streptomyces heilongjiangensis TaxID=945052 RepID=A0ABW1BC12_9ACTN|nr:methyltransferase domain-containing protein [Streptomyces heilongjiangensis]MDC2948770.1 methyltransferase domain-containing protein [Streptomyces heilongjiangensis]
MAEHQALTPDEVGEFYDDRGWLWEIFMGQNLHIGWWDDEDPETDPKDRLTDVLIERTGLKPGSRLLDVGCGQGRPAIRLAQATGGEVTGITVSADQVAAGTRLAEEAGLSDRVRFERVDAMELPYENGAFDAVWAVESVMYLSDRQTAFDEMYRVLAPGGVLVVSDYAESTELSDEWRAVLVEGFTVGSLPTPQQYTGMLEKAGFTIEENYDAEAHLRKSAARIDRTVEENYEKVVAKGGAAFAEEFKAMIGKISRLERDHLGYRVITARKSV